MWGKAAGDTACVLHAPPGSHRFLRRSRGRGHSIGGVSTWSMEVNGSGRCLTTEAGQSHLGKKSLAGDSESLGR